MKLDCPECHQRLQLPDGQEGRQGRCPKCGAIFRIGDTSAVEDDRSETEFHDKPSFEPSGAPTKPEPVGKGAGSSQDQWQLRIADGRVFGPVDRGTLDQWVREGRVGQDSQLKRKTDADWQPAQSFYPYLRTGSASAASPNLYADRPGPSAGNAAVPSHVEPHRAGAILTLGILGFCCWITGVIAIVMGSQDLNKMKSGVMDRSGEGMTRAGFIMGIISTILGALGMLGRVAALNIDF